MTRYYAIPTVPLRGGKKKVLGASGHGTPSPGQDRFEVADFQSVFGNLSNRYRLNIPALKRYAERRKTDSTELLKLGGII